MAEQCTKLAASLSESYRNSDPFDRTKESLPRYLSGHGILLTMCFPYECTLPFGETHLSGSWINSDLGVQVIEGPRIGLALDPLRADIRCLFPTDANTGDRDDAGCGAPSLEETKGSRGASSYNRWTRKAAQKAYTDYKNMNFGPEMPWEDIDCEFLFPDSFTRLPDGQIVSTNPLAWTMGEDGDIEYGSMQSVYQKEVEAIMGHPICTRSNDNSDHRLFLLHQGPEPWDPMDWQEVVDLQMHLNQQENYATMFHWNEIVMGLPTGPLKDIVSGVFYLDSPEFDADTIQASSTHAKAVAKLFGDKPVMRMRKDVSLDGEDLLDCGSEDERVVPPPETERLGRVELRHDLDTTAAIAAHRHLWQNAARFPWL